MTQLTQGSTALYCTPGKCVAHFPFFALFCRLHRKWPGLYGLCLVVAALSDKDTFGMDFFYFVKMSMPLVFTAADLIMTRRNEIKCN